MNQTTIMKKTQFIATAVATLFAASAQFAAAQTDDLILGSFDADAGNTGVMWGSSTLSWDSTQDATGNGGGSLRIESRWSTESDTPLNVYVCIPGANPWWYGSGTINLSEYEAIEFDLRWDNTSTCTIDEWNDPPTYPGGPSAPGNDSIDGIEVNGLSPTSGTRTTIGYTNVPALASSGWVHFSIPIDPGMAGLDPGVGINLAKWIQNNGAITNAATNYLWLDNVMLKGTAAPPPPPTTSLSDATGGLNLITAGSGQYDRHSVRTVGTGYSFYNAPATTTYSYTIGDYPGPENSGFQTHIFLVPNAPAASTSAPDWNSPDVIWLNLQNGGGGTNTLSFLYKTNLPNGNSMYFNAEATNGPVGNLGELESTQIEGTWGMTFENNTNVTIFSPTGSTNIVLPAASAALFNAPLNVYVGTQPNSPDNRGLAAVLSQISISGAASSPNILDNFSPPPLDTNTWEISAADASGIVVTPSDSVYWLEWTLPDSGFAPQTAAPLDSGSWANITSALLKGKVGRKTLVTSGDLPGADEGYFRLLKRQFSQLQVLLPGESPAPGTVTGKTGSPNPVNQLDSVIVTVRAVDDEFYLVSGVNDIVTFSSTDLSAFLPEDGGLVSGEGQFEMFFDSSGSHTVTVSNLSNPAIPSATSSSITVN